MRKAPVITLVAVTGVFQPPLPAPAEPPAIS